MTINQLSSITLKRSNSKSWQYDTDNKTLEGRRKMIRLITFILIKRKASNSKEWLNKSPRVARVLEVVLFSKASSYEDYSDLSTFSNRLVKAAGTSEKQIRELLNLDEENISIISELMKNTTLR